MAGRQLFLPGEITERVSVVVDSGFIGGQGTVIEDAGDPDAALAVTWKEHATLDALCDRFILVRVYGSRGLLFGLEINNR